MAKTQQQWFEHLQRFVPSWQFEQNKFNVAVFQAVAAVFTRLEADANAAVTATYLMQSSAPVIDLHGHERGKRRVVGELDSPYQLRVQRLTNTSDKVSIKAAVDALLVRGECTIYEAPLDLPFCSRGFFCSRNAVFLDFKKDYFLIQVPSQRHPPWASLVRDAYCSRGSYLGSEEQLSQAYVNIIAAVDDMKAFGVMYGIVEKN